MNLHEYQAKHLLSEYDIAIPFGEPAQTVPEALAHAKSIKSNGWIVKAQIHAGGRGKGGGVKFVRDLKELEYTSKKLLGSKLITKQTDAEGQPVNCVLIQEPIEIKKELYLSLLLDRCKERISIIASLEGGADIEEVAASSPEKIKTIHVDPLLGPQPFQYQLLCGILELVKEQKKQFSQIVDQLYQMFIDKDLSLIEINPLVIDDKDNLLALDAKISIDDNALPRQTTLAECFDASQENEQEIEARRYDLNYIKLGGDIACMVNGAGLAMATMDIIKLYGGEPSNFLDVGGGTDADKVKKAFKIISSTPDLKAILINIFGGIVRCDLVATGIINAVKDIGIHVPIVVRLEGTYSEEAKKILHDSGLKIIAANDLADAAEKVVAASQGKS